MQIVVRAEVQELKYSHYLLPMQGVVFNFSLSSDLKYHNILFWRLVLYCYGRLWHPSCEISSPKTPMNIEKIIVYIAFDVITFLKPLSNSPGQVGIFLDKT